MRDFASAIPATSLVAGANSTGCDGTPPSYYNKLIRPIDADLPWPGVIFGLTVSAVWYWCSDQVIVQRALASKNMSHAKGGCILAGYLKILPLYLIVFPGMVARILWPDDIACATSEKCMEVCGSKQGCTNIAYPRLVVRLLPLGVKGLMLSVMMAALMSSLTSIFNSSSTLFTIDIWARIRKKATETELLIVGRVFVVVLVVISILWIPVIQNAQGSRLFDYIQSITSYLAPPVCAVYVLGILWKRINEKGAFWGLMVGLVVGLIRFIAEFSQPGPACGEEDERGEIYLRLIKDVHYLHFGVILFLIVCVVTTVISLLTPAIDDVHLHRLTFWSRFDTEERVDITSKTSDAVANQGGEGGEGGGYDNKGADSEVAVDNSQPPEVDDVVDDTGLPLWRRALNRVCGIKARREGEVELSAEEAEQLHHKQLSIRETPAARRLVNVNALVLVAVGSFIWGYYA